MQSFFRIPEPGPETEAQRERAMYIGMMVKRDRADRRARWTRRLERVARVFHK